MECSWKTIVGRGERVMPCVLSTRVRTCCSVLRRSEVGGMFNAQVTRSSIKSAPGYVTLPALATGSHNLALELTCYAHYANRKCIASYNPLNE